MYTPVLEITAYLPVSGVFLNIVFNDILTMQRFIDISRFLYSGGWQVCNGVWGTQIASDHDRLACLATTFSSCHILQLCFLFNFVKKFSKHKLLRIPSKFFGMRH